MIRMTLGTRLVLFVGLLVTFGLATLSVSLISAHRSQVIDEVIHASDNVAQMIRLSITHEMLHNTPDSVRLVRRVINDVATHSSMERIRLFNKDGEISYSSQPDEIGTMVNKKAEACFQCHAAGKPIRHLSIDDRSRIYKNAAGQRILSTISVIPNEKRCSGTDCHQSPRTQSVLGVLDVSVSMEPTERRLLAATRNAVLGSIGILVLTSLGLFLVIQATVNRPIRNLISAARQVASGDFSQKVSSSTAAAEIGILARSFNEMVENVNSSRTKQREWISKLQNELGKKAKEVRAAQIQTMQAEKLSAVGLVAAGVAHELNSPLMAIITFANLLQRKVDTGSQEHKDLDMIVNEANRCAVIIRNLLDFSREQKLNQQIQQCRPAEILEPARKLAGPKLREQDIQEELLIDESLPDIDVDKAHMTQVFLNLILNAVQAMERGGKLSLRVDAITSEEGKAYGFESGNGTALVRFRFRDTGHGIPQEKIGRVFEPFFTTKAAGEGSGLGLSVSHGIITRHGGTITVDSDGQTWTEFTILVPASTTNGS